MSEDSPTPEFTDEDARALEELADLKDSDPALYESIVREGFAEAERKEQADALLDFINAPRVEKARRDHHLLGRILGGPDEAA